MNTLSTWIVSAVEDPAAPVVWLTVKFTVYLAIAWLVHATLRRLNPRWRVLLWRSSVAGFAILAAFFYLPPLMSWSLPSPPASEDRTVHVATMRDAVSLVANGPSVDRDAKTELAGDQTAPSGQSPPDGHAKSVILPNHAGATPYAVASDRSERARAGLTGFVLAGRRSLYLRCGARDLVWRGPARDPPDGDRPRATGPNPARATEVPPWVVAQGASCPRTRPQKRLRDSWDARFAVTLRYRRLEADDSPPRAAVRGRFPRGVAFDLRSRARTSATARRRMECSLSWDIDHAVATSFGLASSHRARRRVRCRGRRSRRRPRRGREPVCPNLGTSDSTHHNSGGYDGTFDGAEIVRGGVSKRFNGMCSAPGCRGAGRHLPWSRRPWERSYLVAWVSSDQASSQPRPSRTRRRLSLQPHRSARN